MSSPLDHHAIEELLGAYAINAVHEEERAVIESHLTHCDACSAEVKELLGAGSLLGSGVETDVPDLWPRIKDAIAAESAPPPLQLPSRRSRAGRWQRVAISAAAAIIAVVGVFGLGAAFGPRDNDDVTTNELATTAATSPGARIVNLASPTDSAAHAKIVLLPDGRGYIYDTSLPSLKDDRTYQLWAVVNDTPISAGVLGQSVSTVAFVADGPVSAFAVTDEVEGGVVASAQKPVVAGKVTAA